MRNVKSLLTDKAKQDLKQEVEFRKVNNAHYKELEIPSVVVDFADACKTATLLDNRVRGTLYRGIDYKLQSVVENLNEKLAELKDAIPDVEKYFDRAFELDEAGGRSMDVSDLPRLITSKSKHNKALSSSKIDYLGCKLSAVKKAISELESWNNETHVEKKSELTGEQNRKAKEKLDRLLKINDPLDDFERKL